MVYRGAVYKKTGKPKEINKKWELVPYLKTLYRNKEIKVSLKNSSNYNFIAYLLKSTDSRN